MTNYLIEQPWLPFSETLLEWDEDFHELMLSDQLRMKCYRKAIFEAVKPGDTVLDLGTGTGILSLWALEAGARHVYGIDLDAAILDRAVDRMDQAGFGACFDPINQMSYDVQLPQKVDVLISEIMGNMADNEDFQPILQDAIERFLRPGGVTLPLSVTSYLVPVCAQRAHEHVLEGQVESLSAHYDLEALYRQKSRGNPFNLYYDTIIPRSTYLSEPAELRHFHGDWKQAAIYEAKHCFVVHHAASLTGFKVFFIAQLTDHTALDISGDDIDGQQTSASWKHAYLPIEHPVPLKAGDQIDMAFSRRYCHVSERFSQAYGWKGSIQRAGKIIGNFNQEMGDGEGQRN